MLSAALTLVIIALATIFVVRKAKRYRSLQAFGGHWSAGWSRLWLLQTGMSGQMNKRFTEITDKYGEFLWEVKEKIRHVIPTFPSTHPDTVI
jgi:hypothetical protein